MIESPECLGCWGDRYLWHPNTLRGEGAIPGRTGAAPVHGERGAGGRPRRRNGSGDGDPCRAEHHWPPPGRTARRAGRPRGGPVRRPGKPAGRRNPACWRLWASWCNRPSAAIPRPPCLWVSKSQRHLARALTERGFAAGQKLVGRLFAFITQTWRGKPLLTHQMIVQLLASTTTRTGLAVQCRLDRSAYAKGVRVSDAEMATLDLQPAAFPGDGNYTIRPRQPTTDAVGRAQALN